MKPRELTPPERIEGAAVATSPAGGLTPANDCEPAPPRAISKPMEDELYSLLGALLGLLEVLSIDTQDPLTERQRRFVGDALRFGDMLRARVEGLVTLFSDERDERFKRSPYALRRLIDHAVRAASWAAAEKGISIVLPAVEGWEAELLLVDAGRVDRALRAITDTLVSALGKDGRVELCVEDHPEHVQLTLRAHRDGAIPSAALSVSAILLAAWEHVFRLQQGCLRVDGPALTVYMELPKARRGDQCG